jgi:hypothetical protein
LTASTQLPKSEGLTKIVIPLVGVLIGVAVAVITLVIAK